MHDNAMPTSSAHARAWPRPAPPATLRNSIRNGSSARLNRRPDSGHPCVIPAVMKYMDCVMPPMLPEHTTLLYMTP
eukprot:111585-Pyramimonas_sp.AAC.1